LQGECGTNSARDGWVIATSQLATKQLDAVRRKHEHQQNQQNRYLQHTHTFVTTEHSHGGQQATSLPIIQLYSPGIGFSASTLLVGRKEEHPGL